MYKTELVHPKWRQRPLVAASRSSVPSEAADAPIPPSLPRLHNDCDGTPGSCLLLGAASAADVGFALAGASAADQTGYENAVGDLDADGLDDLVVGAPGTDAGGASAGSVVSAPSIGLSLAAAADARMDGEEAGMVFGIAVAVPGDLDGDGFGDLVASATTSTRCGGSGDVYLFRGPVAGALTTADADRRWEGSGVEQLGVTLTATDDVTGDGTPSFVVGQACTSAGSDDAVPMLLCSGLVDSGYSEDEATATLSTSRSGQTGRMVVGGDVDADGDEELLVVSRHNDDYGSRAGAAYLIPGLLLELVGTREAALVWLNTPSKELAGETPHILIRGGHGVNVRDLLENVAGGGLS